MKSWRRSSVSPNEDSSALSWPANTFYTHPSTRMWLTQYNWKAGWDISKGKNLLGQAMDLGWHNFLTKILTGYFYELSVKNLKPMLIQYFFDWKFMSNMSLMQGNRQEIGIKFQPFMMETLLTGNWCPIVFSQKYFWNFGCSLMSL